MSSILGLRAAIGALLPAGIQMYDGQADAGCAPPWLVLGVSVPQVETSEAAAGMGRTATVTVTVAAATSAQALFWADSVDQALVGARPAADGWVAGAITPGERTGPYPAGLTATDTDLRYQVARLGYQITYSPV